MSLAIQAREESALGAQIKRSTPLVYEGKAPDEERPDHVRAASSLTHLVDHFAVVQDDANYLALVERGEHRVQCAALPPGPEGDRVHSKEHGNRGRKLDLEACVDVPGTEGRLLVAFGSGSQESREWIVIVDWRNEDAAEPETTIYDAPAFYTTLREERAFSGSGLNLEGAVFLDEDRMRLFQRGNAEPQDDLQPIDATGDMSYSQLMDHLQQPDEVPPPSLSNITPYEIGALDEVRLTFSDAEATDAGILFSASAEASDYIAGSVLGIINEEGARWTKIIHQDGSIFRGKVEGLTLDPDDATRAFFVIDDDEADKPSDLFEVELRGPWF